MKRILGLLSALTFSSPALPAADYAAGTIVNITSSAAGLFVMLNAAAPDNCAGTPYGWMRIPESAKTMIAVTLISRIQNVPVVIYTSGIDSSGYCLVNQVDPTL